MAQASPSLVSNGEWRELSGPQPGPHGVVTQACGGSPIGGDYAVLPTVACGWRLDANGQRTQIRDCGLRDYCTHAGDCTDEAWGSCVGVPSATCRYPSLDADATCEHDSDCTFQPGGRCQSTLSDESALCYPTGECIESRTDMGVCSYGGIDLSCRQDADCTLEPGGHCERVILYSTCAYDECRQDADCGPKARCDCQGVRRCVTADCFGDSDCPEGMSCSPSPALQCGNLNPVASYHCRTPNDECSTDQDCLERCGDGDCQETCVFDPDRGSWGCRSVICLTR
jgi:hypothetical protein